MIRRFFKRLLFNHAPTVINDEEIALAYVRQSWPHLGIDDLLKITNTLDTVKRQFPQALHHLVSQSIQHQPPIITLEMKQLLNDAILNAEYAPLACVAICLNCWNITTSDGIISSMPVNIKERSRYLYDLS